MDKFIKMRHIFDKMLQIMVSLKNDHLVEENKKPILSLLCSSKKNQILTNKYFNKLTQFFSDFVTL